jgi:RND superfamily putative drug exporter
MNDNQTKRPFFAHKIRLFSLPIILIWLAVAVLLNVFVPQLEKVAEDVSVPLSPTEAPSVYGMKWIGQKFNEYDSDNLAIVVLVGEDKLGDDAHDYYDDLVKKLEKDTDHVQNVLDFWGHRFTSSGVESYDHKAAYVQVNLAGNQGGAHGNQSVKSVRQIVDDSKPPDGVKAYVAGQGALTSDTIQAGDKSMAKMTLITIIVITIMLALVYRSITTVLLVLFVVFVEMAAGRGLIALMGTHGLLGLSTFAVSLLTALSIAAGTDYAIFLIGRFHEGIALGMDRETAYYDTFAGVTRVILGSGLTIVGATFCLYFTRLPYFSSLGIPCSVGLLVVVLAALTLGPAVLGAASRFGLLYPKREFNYRRWRRVATAIVRWPGPILVTALALVFIGTLGLAGFEPLYNERYYLPNSVASKKAYDSAKKHFTEARLNPDLLMVESDHDLRNTTDLLVLDRVAKRLFQLEGIERVQSITRPLGPPIEHGSVPFQVAVGSAPIRDNLNYLKDRIADTKKIADDLGATIKILEHMLDLTNQLTAATHDTTTDTKDTADTTDEVRNDLADFEDFFRPIRNYFHWEKHCYTIPFCWALRALWDSIDGVDKLADNAAALAKDSDRIDRLIPQLRDQLPPMIALSKDIHEKTLTMHTTFDSLITQMDRLTDTSLVMAQAFDDSKVDEVFYVPPEIFDNPDFQLGLKLMVTPDGKGARFIITHDTDPATAEGISTVDDERKAAREALKLTTLADAKISLGGTAATYKDIADGAKIDLMIAASAAIMLIFIIMILITRALVPSFVIVGTIVMSLGAAFGTSTLIWQHLVHFKIHWVALEFALIVLLAVGSDYNLMLVSRFEEEIGAGLKTGIIRGMGSTGPVVTAAGLVFAFTMGSMITSDLRSIGQFGTTIGIGLLFDTLVVRSFITPSIATLLGRWFWWPKRVRTRPASEMLRSVGSRPLVRALLDTPFSETKAGAASSSESPPPSSESGYSGDESP